MIELIHVTKAFGSKKVIDDLSLKIPANRITVIMGGSGHGKSTIVKLILGFIIPDSGEIIVDEANVLEMSKQQSSTVWERCENSTLSSPFAWPMMIPISVVR